ncbi:High-affinity branched-chain amino acid transport ATP-binding protein LivF [Rhodobacteraceae bacterium THAF1]|uniref:urea ABC transporter ATP-binding subunit UrtE n=1 Tax=Palleronia sp. THAF1 TaxID=2587842 RepID=UPI000F3D45D8|nr:urea ABC transporter ATP-binding subunit UrtE [Palleronia sp. THAF1]QFU08179.1 High-affinity branched-chain amino acid transport ATP-binding protein LivF [Palleronia sp. THAF1]VDC28731.1 High-affinity branched-chain amino acid transport ATP-binding protein LivF [Rhodobacteraceae bacterium THAF1]
MLEVQNLTLRYGQSQVLHGIDLTAKVGEVTAIMGMNGVGKTSLMKAIAGRHPFSGGTILLDGADLGHPNAAQAAKAGIAYVPQGREIFPRLTVTENIETAFACLPRSERTIPDRIYELFPVLAEMRARRGGDLSGGQQQQLAIARALVTRPRVLLLDEPTEGIQPSVIKDIGRVIAALRDEGEMAVVLVEQFFDFAVAAADEMYAVRGGRVVLQEHASDLDRETLLQEISL